MQNPKKKAKKRKKSEKPTENKNTGEQDNITKQVIQQQKEK